MRKLLTLHRWIGVSAGLFLVMMAVTGVVLNHEEQFGPQSQVAIHNTLALARGARLEALPVPPSQALELAFAHVGAGVSLDRLELRTTGSGLVYKLETTTKTELYIDPVTGAVHQSGQNNLNLVRVADMLHTGEGLLDAPWFYDAIALAMLTLVISGAYLFFNRLRP